MTDDQGLEASSETAESETANHNPLTLLDEQSTDRRRFMLAGATGAAAGLAGCAGGGGDTPTPRVIEQERTVVKEKTVEVTPEPEAPNYVVTSHVMVGSDISNYKDVHFAASCAPQYQFVPGQTIKWRIGIWDPDTGEQLTNKNLESVTVTVEGPASFGPIEADWEGDNEEHPHDQWGAVIRDTADLPPGQYTWTVHVTDSDAKFTHVGIWQSTFTLLEPGSVPTVTPTPGGG